MNSIRNDFTGCLNSPEYPSNEDHKHRSLAKRRTVLSLTEQGQQLAEMFDDDVGGIRPVEKTLYRGLTTSRIQPWCVWLGRGSVVVTDLFGQRHGFVEVLERRLARRSLADDADFLIDRRLPPVVFFEEADLALGDNVS